MRILLLSLYFPPDIGPGSLRAKSILDALIKNGSHNLKVDVITAIPNRYKLYNQDFQDYEKNINYEIHRIKIPKHRNKFFDQIKSFIYYAFAVLYYTKKKNYDVVVSSSSRLMTAALGAYIAKNKNSKLYLDIRDLFFDTMNCILKNKLLRLLLPIIYFVERWTFNSANKINIISGGFLTYFQDNYPNIRPTIYTNGIDDSFLDFNFLKKLKNKKCKILYAGNIGDGQGLDKIIPEVAYYNPNFQFKIIGDGSARSKLINNKLFNIYNNIDIIDPISRDKLLDEYASADILLIHLNDYSAFQKVLPSKIFEYAATNKPILAGVSGYPKNFLLKEIPDIEVFDPCDYKAMSKSIYKINKTKKLIDRNNFITKYRRTKIMIKMAKDIIELV